jgi:hypothetical protein
VLAQVKVNKAHLKRGARIASMPEAVLRMLEQVEVTNETASALIRLENTLRRDELQRGARGPHQRRDLGETPSEIWIKLR